MFLNKKIKFDIKSLILIDFLRNGETEDQEKQFSLSKKMKNKISV